MIGTKKYLAGMIVLLVATIGTAYKDGLLSTPETTRLRIPFDQLPKEIGGWKLVGPDNLELSKAELEFIQPDAYIRRAYQKGEDMVVLYVAYFGNRLEGQKRIHHNAAICMVAAGYAKEDVAEIDGENQIFSEVAKSIPLDHLYFTKKGSDHFVTQFFSVDGRLLKESPKPKSEPLNRLLERFETRLKDAGYCFQVQVGHRPHGDVPKAREVHRRFLQDTVETILRHFPAESGGH